jgi:hypothetical protein
MLSPGAALAAEKIAAPRMIAVQRRAERDLLTDVKWDQ